MTDEALWRRLFDRTVHAYYEGNLAEGRDACETLLALPGVPDHVRDQARRNSVFYAPPLADLVATCGLRRVDLPLAPGWFPLNPSIAADGDGYLMVVRTVDYEILAGGWYRHHDPDNVIHTVNHLVRLDQGLNIAAGRPIVDETGAGLPESASVGLEDCRLFRWRGEWRVSATVADRNPGRVGQIALADLDPTVPAIRNLRLLSDWSSGRWEKNWMPFVRGDDLFFVYRCGPTIVLRYRPEESTVEEVAHRPAPPLAADLKGGSTGVRVDRGWLFAVHETADFPEGDRCYLHRFLRLDDAFRLTELSAPFRFAGRGIEFCGGLARRGDTLVAAFGRGDREACLARLTLPEVLGLLRPVPGERDRGAAVAPVAFPAAPPAAGRGGAVARPGDDERHDARRAVLGSGTSGLTIEAALAIDERVWHLRGSIAADAERVVSLDALLPGGERIDLRCAFAWLPVPPPGGPGARFSARLIARRPFGQDERPVVRVGLANGVLLEAPTPPVTVGDRPVLEALKAEIDPDQPLASWTVLPHLHGSIEPVHARIVCSARVVHDEAVVPPPGSPRATVVVPIYREIKLFERQLRALATDPDLYTCEVIYLLDGPEGADAFLTTARELGRQYPLPLRVLVSDRNAGYARANNLAVDAASAPLLLLLNSDCFPIGRGWLARLAARWRAIPDVGAIGPKLLYPDGRVQGDGNDYVRLEVPPCWNWQTRHWGVRRDDPAVLASQPVRGVGSASLFIATDLYRVIGGLPDHYLTGQFEDVELCNRLRRRGLQPWYCAEVEMVHEEAQTYQGPGRRREWLYNAWLHDRLWGAFLTAGG